LLYNKVIANMRTIKLTLKGSINYQKAETEARKAASEAGAVSLLAWYDREKGAGAPREVCSKETWKCPRDYAEHHKADVRVSINGDAYEFFFTRIAAGADSLDSDEVVSVHHGIPKQQFDNIQGG
jgi:hypothetical protein